MALDKFYTAFVSSTFRDLAEERAAVAQALMRLKCFPLGMEYFPAAGGAQWEYIEESLAAADFCILISGGRYGSLDPETGLSWTHREYREARVRNKLIVPLLRRSLGQLSVTASDTDSAANLEFRRELEDSQECGYFDDLREIERAVGQAVDHLKTNNLVGGWQKAPRSGTLIDERLFDRLYEVAESHHRYSISRTSPDRLDLEFSGRRLLRSNVPQGLAKVALDFTKSSEKIAAFDPGRPVTVSLDSWSREGSGTVRMADPRKTTGAAFVVDAVFDPPLREGERAEFAFSAFIPEYRFMHAAELAQATEGTPGGSRTFDFISKKISHPTRKLVQSVSFDPAIGVTLLGPRSGRHGHLDFTDSPVPSADTYSNETDKDEWQTMRYTSNDPELFMTYRLAWRLA